MNHDWKDALSNLRGNFEESNQEAINPENEVTNKKRDIQNTPLTIITDKKGRNGKIATIIEGFTVNQAQVENIARQLKQKLGVGGSIREGEILIQGDHKTAATKFLQSLNFKIK